MIETEFDQNRDVMLVKLKGIVTVPELVESYEQALADKRFRQGMNAVWDLTYLQLRNIPLKDVQSLPGQLGRFMAQRGKTSAALVTNRKTDFQLLRIYLTILRLIGKNVRIRLFNNVEAAYSWLQEQEQKKEAK